MDDKPKLTGELTPGQKLDAILAATKISMGEFSPVIDMVSFHVKGQALSQSEMELLKSVEGEQWQWSELMRQSAKLGADLQQQAQLGAAGGSQQLGWQYQQPQGPLYPPPAAGTEYYLQPGQVQPQQSWEQYTLRMQLQQRAAEWQMNSFTPVRISGEDLRTKPVMEIVNDLKDQLQPLAEEARVNRTRVSEAKAKIAKLLRKVEEQKNEVLSDHKGSRKNSRPKAQNSTQVENPKEGAGLHQVRRNPLLSLLLPNSRD